MLHWILLLGIALYCNKNAILYCMVLCGTVLYGTSNSRPWRSIGSFMYIGSAGPGPGGRTDGRTGGGRTGGRRADGRTGGRADFERQYNDFHRFSQKASKNTVFFCRFASGGSASTDFYSSNEECVQKHAKTNCFFFFLHFWTSLSFEL